MNFRRIIVVLLFGVFVAGGPLPEIPFPRLSESPFT